MNKLLFLGVGAPEVRKEGVHGKTTHARRLHWRRLSYQQLGLIPKVGFAIPSSVGTYPSLGSPSQTQLVLFNALVICRNVFLSLYDWANVGWPRLRKVVFCSLPMIPKDRDHTRMLPAEARHKPYRRSRWCYISQQTSIQISGFACRYDTAPATLLASPILAGLGAYVACSKKRPYPGEA